MWQKVAKVQDIAEGASQIIDPAGESVALFKLQGCFYAVDNICPHEGGPLGEGSLEGSLVTCPWHAWQFDVKTGQCQDAADIFQKTFATKIAGDDVFIEI